MGGAIEGRDEKGKTCLVEKIMENGNIRIIQWQSRRTGRMNGVEPIGALEERLLGLCPGYNLISCVSSTLLEDSEIKATIGQKGR